VVLGGGLEPDFRVLFSAIFHGVSLGDFHLGRNLWKWAEAKVWSFVVNLRTKFLSVAIVSLPFHGDIENPRAGTNICDNGASPKP
jgi:hypothetical protein